MRALKKLVFPIITAAVLAGSSCKTDKVIPSSESVKTIAGSWKIIKATRNGTDITSFYGLDFSQFRITFGNNNTYTLTNNLPFIVSLNGSYSLNDPNVPTQITFTESGSGAQAPITTVFTYPIVTGVRNIDLTFTANPGCNNNSYVYTLQKAN